MKNQSTQSLESKFSTGNQISFELPQEEDCSVSFRIRPLFIRNLNPAAIDEDGKIIGNIGDIESTGSWFYLNECPSCLLGSSSSSEESSSSSEESSSSSEEDSSGSGGGGGGGETSSGSEGGGGGETSSGSEGGGGSSDSETGSSDSETGSSDSETGSSGSETGSSDSESGSSGSETGSSGSEVSDPSSSDSETNSSGSEVSDPGPVEDDPANGGDTHISWPYSFGSTSSSSESEAVIDSLTASAFFDNDNVLSYLIPNQTLPVRDDHWALEWAEIDNECNFSAIYTKRSEVCQFPGTNVCTAVTVLGTPKGAVLESTTSTLKSTEPPCDPNCIFSTPWIMYKVKINQDVIKNELKHIAGLQWELLNHISNSVIPYSGNMGPGLSWNYNYRYDQALNDPSAIFSNDYCSSENTTPSAYDFAILNQNMTARLEEANAVSSEVLEQLRAERDAAFALCCSLNAVEGGHPCCGKADTIWPPFGPEDCGGSSSSSGESSSPSGESSSPSGNSSSPSGNSSSPSGDAGSSDTSGLGILKKDENLEVGCCSIEDESGAVLRFNSTEALCKQESDIYILSKFENAKNIKFKWNQGKCDE